MRRALFDTVSVVIGSGKVVDREGFLSTVYAASIGSITGSPTAAKLTVKVEHCDTKDGLLKWSRIPSWIQTLQPAMAS